MLLEDLCGSKLVRSRLHIPDEVGSSRSSLESPPFVTQTEDVLKTEIKTKGTGHPPDPRPAYSSWGWKHLGVLPPALSLFVV